MQPFILWTQCLATSERGQRWYKAFGPLAVSISFRKPQVFVTLTDLDSFFFSSKNGLLGRNGRLGVESRAVAHSGLRLCFVSELIHMADTLTGFNIYVQYESIPLHMQPPSVDHPSEPMTCHENKCCFGPSDELLDTTLREPFVPSSGH